MGLFGNLLGGVTKLVLTPVAVAVDVVKVATGQEADTTKDLIESAVEDVKESIEDLGNGEL